MNSAGIFAANSSTQDTAGSRVASFILVKTWYKACRSTKKLRSDLNLSSQECQRAKLKLETKKTDYYRMQKDVEDLTCNLRFSQKEVRDLVLSVDEHVLKIKTLKETKQALFGQFNDKCEECLSINQHISEFKKKLSKNLENKQELEIQFEASKLKAESVSENGDLLDAEFAKLKIEKAECEKKLFQQLEEVENKIRDAKKEKSDLKIKLQKLKDFTKEYENIETKMPNASVETEKTLLRHEVAVLRETLEKTFERKFRNNVSIIGKYVLKGLEILLPALPRSNI